MNKITITSIMWSSYVPSFISASKKIPFINLHIFSHKQITEDLDALDKFLKYSKESDIVFLYLTDDGFWDNIYEEMTKQSQGKLIISTSFDPIKWGKGANVDVDVCARAYEYISNGGEENYKRLLIYLASLLDKNIICEEPSPMPYQGIIRPPDTEVYSTYEEYLEKYPKKNSPTVGILFSRNTFINSDRIIEEELIFQLEKQGLNILPVFSHWVVDKDAGAIGPIETAKRYFFDRSGNIRISALINMQFFFMGREDKSSEVANESVNFFKKLNIPVFKPVISYSLTPQEWYESPQGLISDVTFGIAMPEFEGNIEPIIIGCSEKFSDKQTGSSYEKRYALKERIEHVAKRVARWVRLKEKPVNRRKVAFIIHKNECAGLEATLGSAAGLDSGESIVRIMKLMKEKGYKIDNIPNTGEVLFKEILNKKAIAEFRWTTVDEIISKGGYLELIPTKIYNKWFNKLSLKAQKDIVNAWGEPPGKELNGVPPSMVYEDKLVITGLQFGNAVVMMQPKRGCAGSRCDGQVCKILHDPDIPPPHQYIASYMYLDKIFKADVIIHVGTHGNLEWLPGKGAGLSNSCWPDIAIGHLPHLYIYNCDNPAEGIVAKRRSYATLIDHLQAPQQTSDTYNELAKLDELINEYLQAKDLDRARAHQIQHLINDQIEKSFLKDKILNKKFNNFNEVVSYLHKIITKVKNSQTKTGMHIFGEKLDRDKTKELINTILRFDTSNELNTYKIVFDAWNEDISYALKFPEKLNRQGIPYSKLIYIAEQKAIKIISMILQGKDIQDIINCLEIKDINEEVKNRILRFIDLVEDIDKRIKKSDEIGSLLKGTKGEYIPPGPSGFLSRGRYDILPTGRNFYNVDITRIPTKSAHRVGVLLAESLLKKYLKEQGNYPKKIGMVWLASDIMRADGEQVCQIFHLIGVRPKWKQNGQIDGFEIIPLDELKRPRIDVHIRVSGILRDCFPAMISYVDEAISRVALLDEPEDKNYIKKHILELARKEREDIDNPDVFRRLSFRIFCAQPGVYKSGVNLAVYASAWKVEKDLSDIYVYWNGYAYGGGGQGKYFGVPAHKELVHSLKDVEVTFDKHISDETDFLSCCAYFGNYGGMTTAVKDISGKKPKTYYGDTRNPANVDVVDLKEEINRVVLAKLLNPKYIKGMKKHGYKGAGDISKRIGRVYGFGATTGEVEDWVFNEIANNFVLNEEMKKWFLDVNPWAIEEIGRRLIEAASRKIWKPDKKTLDKLKASYLEIEGNLEDTLDEIRGEFQGGNIDIYTAQEISSWKEKLNDILENK